MLDIDKVIAEQNSIVWWGSHVITKIDQSLFVDDCTSLFAAGA